MKKLYSLVLALLVAAPFAFAQPSPQPNPWVKAGSSISYSLGGILAPSSVTGGTKGVGTFNATNYYINGSAIPSSVFGRNGAVVATFGDYSFSLISGTAAVAQGGTGLTGGNSGGVLYFNTNASLASSAALTNHGVMLGGGVAGSPTALSDIGTSTKVLHGNASGNPTFSAVSLTADVTGTLAVGNGGTGATTLTGLVVGNGSGAMTAYAGATCSNQFLRSLSAAGSGTCNSVSLSADVTGNLGVANLNGGSGASAATVWCGNATWCTPPAFSAAAGTVVAASTTDLSASGQVVQTVTGNTTITSFGSGASLYRVVTFTGTPILTYNATSLITPTGANIQAAPGDSATLKSDGSGNWTIVAYQPFGLTKKNLVTAVSINNSAYTNLTSMSLTPGKWRISVQLNGSNPGGDTYYDMGISVNSASVSGTVGGDTYGYAPHQTSGIYSGFLATEVTLTATTTYYFTSSSSSSTQTVNGNMLSQRLY